MASLGHPILGDTLYGGRAVSEHDLTGAGSDAPLIEHQALHAHSLRVVHPINERPIEFTAPLPANMLRILDLLQKHRRS
jgi:23S rRNA pseudouridine1911/1915/1917 synthase